MSEIKIPFVIGGEVINREDYEQDINFKDKQIKITLPELSQEDIKKIKQTKKSLYDLHELSSEEIISFLLKAGEKWKKGNELRDKAEKDVQELTGYSKEMIDFSFQQIDNLLKEDYLNLILNSELGDKKLVDKWVERGEAYIHCQPKGTALHILAGNAPPISVLSLIRGLLTKNVNVFKIPSGDLITLPYFLQTFNQVDPNHPITKSISAVYWPSSNQDLLKEIISLSNVVCVWGSGEAVETVKSLSLGKEILEFGPRRGIQLIGKEVLSDEESLKDAAKKAAHDLVVFDQEACFSPQICFIEGNKEDAKKYAENLEESLKQETEKYPRGKTTTNKVSLLNQKKQTYIFLGNEIFHSPSLEYTLVITEDLSHADSHPLGRTLFIIPINDFKDVLNKIRHETQVVAIEPFSRAYELRERLTIQGVDRITHLGKMPYFAAGAPHDGIYPLARLVRWVKSR